MNALEPLLRPIENVIAWVLAGAVHLLEGLGLSLTSGVTWLLAVVLLVVCVRIALLPLFYRQIKTSRAMAAMAPALRELQAKYKGRTDQASRLEMAQKTQELRRQHGVKGMGCLPALLQAPVFLALFWVLRSMSQDTAIGALTQPLVDQAGVASLAGARLSDTFLSSPTASGKVVIAAILVLAAAATLVTQLVQQRLNTPAQPDGQDAMAQQMQRMMRMIIFVAPVMLLVSGAVLPLGVLIYWLASNAWTLGQQLVIIRFLPNPGSVAHSRRVARAQQPARPAGAGGELAG